MASREEKLALQILNPIFLVVTVVLNALAGSGVLGNETIGDVSDENPTMLTPADNAFSIWSAIYTGLTGVAVISIFSKTFNQTVLFDTTNGIGWIYIINLTLNCLWIIFFTFNETWSMVVCLVDIHTLVMITWLCYQRIQRIRLAQGLTLIENIVYGLGFGLYSGWLTCATCLNFLIVLQRLGDNTFSTAQWFGQVVLLAIFVLFTINMWIYKEPFMPVVCCWAFSWIAVNQWDTYTNVSWTAVLLAAAMAVQVVLISILYYIPSLMSSSWGVQGVNEKKVEQLSHEGYMIYLNEQNAKAIEMQRNQMI